jgi:hypothetical protein
VTKHLNPMDPEDALYAACRAYPGGVERVAELRDVSVQTMYQKLDKDNDRGRVAFGKELNGFIDLLRAAAVPIWDAPLVALSYRHGGLFVRLPHIDENAGRAAHELTQDILDMVRDQGRLATVLSDAMANDHEVDSREFESFAASHAAAMSTLARMGEHVREMHERAKAAGRVR